MIDLPKEIAYLISNCSGQASFLAVTSATKIDGKIVILPKPELCVITELGEDEDLIGRLFVGNVDAVFPINHCRWPSLTEKASIDRHCHIPR